jgi:hypothetical protein
MTNLRSQLIKRYITALKDHLGAGQEASLEAAYMLGRNALDCGLGILDMVAIHQQALAEMLPTLHVYFGRIRTKLGPKHGSLLETLTGVGYSLHIPS